MDSFHDFYLLPSAFRCTFVVPLAYKNTPFPKQYTILSNKWGAVHTLVKRNMRKEDLRLSAGLTTNMIANMGKGKHISMETLLRICKALNCGILNVIELEHDEEAEISN